MSSRWTPSIVPNDREDTVYIVEDDFGKVGRAYRETEIGFEDLESTVNDLISGQYNNPVRIVAFNTEEGWARDVSRDIAREIQRRHDMAAEDVPSHVEDFVDRYAGRDRQLALRLV